MMANRKEEQPAEAGPGEIVAVSGLSHTVTGDTLCEAATPILLEPMQFPSTVVSMAIEPRTQADREKLTAALAKLTREDPTFEVRNDAETAQLVISGMGELHLEVIKNRLLEDYGVDANVGEPRVAYKETVAAEREAEGRIVQQTGTRGTFAVVKLRVSPAALRGKVSFINEVPPQKIKRRFIAAIETGVTETARGGVVTGYPLINVGRHAARRGGTSLRFRRRRLRGGRVHGDAQGGGGGRRACSSSRSCRWRRSLRRSTWATSSPT